MAVAVWRERICSNSRGGVNGSFAKRMPVASVNAFAIAAATGLTGLSLIGLAPIGPTVSVVVGEIDFRPRYIREGRNSVVAQSRIRDRAAARQ